jgi:nucleoside-diphosphate-sugar epimerase
MNLIVVGGSGRVGTLVLPDLAQRHVLRVFDLVPPSARVPYLLGDVRDYDGLLAACSNQDAMLYMAGGALDDWGQAANVRSHFDANVTAQYLALMAANAAGIGHAVVLSSMSIFAGLYERVIESEDEVADADDHYGLSKRLGEEVCRVACRQWSMTINVLRLCLPTAPADWNPPPDPFISTHATDVAQAIDLALHKRFEGFEAFTINGDGREERLKLMKAKLLLGWQPTAPRTAGSKLTDFAASPSLANVP